MVKNLACRAGNLGSIPGRVTKISHAVGQLSLSATAGESMYHSERSHVIQ